MSSGRQQLIKTLCDEYTEMCSLDEAQLATRFAADFSGLAGAEDVLIRDPQEWLRHFRRDFALQPGRTKVDVLDVVAQNPSDDVAVMTTLLRMHQHTPDNGAAQRVARHVQIRHREGNDWRIVHCSVWPAADQSVGRDAPVARNVHEQNRVLEELVEERTEELLEARRRLATLSPTDELTGIFNRRHFERQLALEWERGLRGSAPVALVVMDLDFFAHYNKHYGTKLGDACLQEIAGALAVTARRAGDLVARTRGDEFSILLPNTNEHEALQLARNVQQAVLSLAIPHVGVAAGVVSLSIGVASSVPAHPGNAVSLQQQAEAALVHAQTLGRNCIHLARD